MKKTYLILLLVFLTGNLFSQYVRINNGAPGVTANVINQTAASTTIEYTFNGYFKEDLQINGINCVGFTAPGMINLMEKDMPQLLTFRKSIIIPDMAGMNYRIVSVETEEVPTATVMPSKGHMTRDIDISKVPYNFGSVYRQDAWYPANNVVLDEPYIIRDLRGMTVQINPMQYNAAKNVMRIHKRIVIEVYKDASKQAVNPFYRVFPLTKVDMEFAPIYRDMFMNYGIGDNRYDSITEPGRLLVIYASQYASTVPKFVNWKIQRGFTVLTAEYPTATGSGAAAIKTYIQTKYNETQKVTYIVLMGESNEIPYLNGAYENAPSDPCYVKLAGTDAYPDAFISRMSVSTPAKLDYVITKVIKYERDILVGDPWYKKGLGVASNESGGTGYTDWQRMNMLRDTLMLHSWTQVDQVYDPGATSTAVTNSFNDGRSIMNYIGHGSGTSWSTSGFNVTNANNLANGWKNTFIIDVSCLNGNFTLGECLAEAFLRAGDTTAPRGCITMYSASTNASWVPPCDMQTHMVYLLSHGYRKSAGGIYIHGLMKGMDMWGGSSGEGLKLMEQYHIFGDCSTLITWGIPLGPMIQHTPLPNTENVAGPYTVNCVITPLNSPLDPSKTKVMWTRGSAFTDSVQLTNTSGNNWTANIPGNGVQNTYKYYIKSCDMMNRYVTSPGGAPANYYSFQASPDIIKPVIVHTGLGNIPKTNWPATVSANVTDNIGLDSVWVRWYKNNTSTGVKHFKLNNTGGANFSAAFNSVQADVNYNDSIFYRVFARDNSSNHNTDSTTLKTFKIIAIANACIGTGTTSIAWPYNTYWHDSKTQMLYTAAEILGGGGAVGNINKIGFNILTAQTQAMNGFSIKMQNTTATSISSFVTTGWTNVYTGTYTVPGTGWRFIDLQTPFAWNGQNLLIEICFDNTSYTNATNVAGSSATGMCREQHGDNAAGCSFSGGTNQTTRPNICLEINLLVGNQNPQIELPKVFSLAQNYPNPFNPSTSIKFALPKQSLVKLVIYDVVGREVATLVNGVKQAGSYEAIFNATNFASGVYFYRLEADNFVDVKKMILIK